MTFPLPALAPLLSPPTPSHPLPSPSPIPFAHSSGLELVSAAITHMDKFTLVDDMPTAYPRHSRGLHRCPHPQGPGGHCYGVLAGVRGVGAGQPRGGSLAPRSPLRTPRDFSPGRGTFLLIVFIFFEIFSPFFSLSAFSLPRPRPPPPRASHLIALWYSHASEGTAGASKWHVAAISLVAHHLCGAVAAPRLHGGLGHREVWRQGGIGVPVHSLRLSIAPSGVRCLDNHTAAHSSSRTRPPAPPCACAPRAALLRSAPPRVPPPRGSQTASSPARPCRCRRLHLVGTSPSSHCHALGMYASVFVRIFLR